jgi:hypothetical protein
VLPQDKELDDRGSMRNLTGVEQASFLGAGYSVAYAHKIPTADVAERFRSS